MDYATFEIVQTLSTYEFNTRSVVKFNNCTVEQAVNEVLKEYYSRAEYDEDAGYFTSGEVCYWADDIKLICKEEYETLNLYCYSETIDYPSKPSLGNDKLTGKGPLSTFFNDEVLEIPGQTPFEIYEASVLCAGESRYSAVAVGEYNSDAWESVGMEDTGIVFWLSEDELFNARKAFINGNASFELGDGNYLCEIMLETKTVFDFNNDDSHPYVDFIDGESRHFEVGLVDVVYHNGSEDSACRPDEIVWLSHTVKSWREAT
jgi:hypothetical protein